MVVKSSSLYELPGVAMYYQPEGCDPAYDVVPADTERVELVIGGRGWLRTPEGFLEVRPGHLLWHIMGEETISRSDWKNPYFCLSLHLRIAAGYGRQCPRISFWADLESARFFCDQVVRWNADETISRDGLSHYIIGSMLIHASQSAQKADARVPTRVNRALQVIEDRHCGKISVSQLARAAGLSSSHLHALFREHFNASPHEMIIRYRLRTAREQLTGTARSIKEIALGCGFTSAAAFCHTFRSQSGETPLAYRNRQLGKSQPCIAI